jgi:hypothetical protein
MQAEVFFVGTRGGFMLKRMIRPWLLAVALVMWLGSCDTIMDLLMAEIGGWEDENPPVEPDPPKPEPDIPSFYVNAGGSDSNNGLSESAPFKTLAKAYTAALGSLDHKRIVVLSNLIETGLVTLDPAGKTVQGTGPITIEGKTAGLKIERSVGMNDSVLEIKGGAQVAFKNIKINGITNDIVFHRALRATGTGTKVALRDGVVVTGKITTNSGDGEPNNKDGSGILIDSSAELVMTGNSLVTECQTIAVSGHPKAAVVVYGAGKVTMYDHATVSNNTVTYNVSTADSTEFSFAAGVVTFGENSLFTMNDDAVIRNNQSSSSNGPVDGGGVTICRGSVFVMNDRAALKDNTAFSTNGRIQGGGVYVTSGGTLVMNDNTAVSGNTAISTNNEAGGGGVFIYTTLSSSFMMNGGVISGNTAIGGTTSYGGGVHQASSNSNQFTMNSGIIYGNNAGNLSNTANGGAAYDKAGNGTVTPATLGTTNNTIINGVITGN